MKIKLLFLILCLASNLSFAEETEFPLSLDQKHSLGTVTIKNNPNEYEISYIIEGHEDLKMNCTFALDYRIQSQDVDGSFNDFYKEDLSIEFKTEKFGVGGGSETLSDIAENLIQRKLAFDKKYPGISFKLEIESIRMNPLKSECSLKRPTFDLVCNDYFDPRGLLNNSERKFMQAFNSKNDCRKITPDRVEDLNIQASSVTGLELLKFFRNLSKLDISQNTEVKVEDLRFAGSLRELNINGIRRSDLAILNSLTNMQILKLANNSVTDVTFLKKMSDLMELDISQNKVSSLNNIVSKKLIKLNASQNILQDIQFLNNNINVVDLNLASNQISDFSILKSLKDLSSLSIANNNIQKIAPFKNSSCPISSKEFDFDELDDEVKQGLTMSGHVNNNNGGYYPYPSLTFHYVALAGDLLSKKCDEAARTADRNYDAAMIIVPAPTPKPVCTYCF